MGLLETAGVNSDFISKLTATWGYVPKFIGLLILFGITGIIFFVVLNKKRNKQKFCNKLYWFEALGEKTLPKNTNNMDLASEITIPGTNLKVFYIKSKDMYLPRPTRRMGENAYWLGITKNNEVINFDLTNINKVRQEAGLDMDHTDQRGANEYLRELIQRNYRDKALPWWREYKELIATVVLIFVFSLAMIFIIGKLGGVVDKIGLLIDHADQVVKSVEALKSSGVIQAK